MSKTQFPFELPDDFPLGKGFSADQPEDGPPPVSPPPAPAPSGDRDQFLTDTARRELETTQDLYRFLPAADLHALEEIGHPVKSHFLNPGQNANLSVSNLHLLWNVWEKHSPDRKPEDLAKILALAHLGSEETWHSQPEPLPEDWLTGETHPYADSGYWGRGFARLTWKESYFKLGEELGLDLIAFPELAILPAIAAEILGTSLFVSGISKAGTLAQYLRVGAPGNKQLQSRLKKSIAHFGELIRTHDLLHKGPLHLHAILLKGENGGFPPSVILADANSILNAFEGDFSFSEKEEEAEVRQTYLAEQQFWGTKRGTFQEKLIRFQAHFNHHCMPVRALNEQGVLDPETHNALSLGGFVFRTGKLNVLRAFQGQIPSLDPMAQAHQQCLQGLVSEREWALALCELLPLPDEGQFLEIMKNTEEGKRRKMAIALCEVSASANKMGLLGRAILPQLHNWLESDSLVDEVARAISGAFSKSAAGETPAVKASQQIESCLARTSLPAPNYHLVSQAQTATEWLAPYEDQELKLEELSLAWGGAVPDELLPGMAIRLPDRIRPS